MADTARTKPEEKEFFDSPEELDKKIKLLAKLVARSKHFIAFTGAGISTSAGIPDFRSGVDTVLDTGAGKWAKDAAIAKGIDVKPAKRVTSTLQAMPTITHMALVKLAEEDRLKFVISQNTDGLHRRSGLPVSKLAELHGNSNLERCSVCAKQYLRDYRTRTAKSVSKHLTGRICTALVETAGEGKTCGGALLDTIVNFGETLPTAEYATADIHSGLADVCLAMGSSLTVTPAADFAKSVGKRKQNLVIVNLQATPLDKYASLRINAKTDEVMRGLMRELALDIPQWHLLRYVRVSRRMRALTVAAVDSDGTPASLFATMSLDIGSLKARYEAKAKAKVYDLLPPKTVQMPESWNSEDSASVTVGFVGHYGEPENTLNLKSFLQFDKLDETEETACLLMTFDPIARAWLENQSWGSEGIDELAEALSSVKISSASATASASV